MSLIKSEDNKKWINAFVAICAGVTGFGGVGGSGGDGYYDPGYANLIMQELSVAFLAYNYQQQKLKEGEGESTATTTPSSLGTKIPIFNQYRSFPETSIIDSKDVMDILCSNSISSRSQQHSNFYRNESKNNPIDRKRRGLVIQR